jgi:bla regulator protein BlaR1
MDKLIQHLFSDNVAQALCLTLIHSLWEGLCLAFITGLIILLTRTSRATVRYSLLVATLLLYTVVVGITFFSVLSSADGENLPVVGLNLTEQSNFTSMLLSYFNYLLKYIHEHAGLINGIWLLLAVVQNIRLCFDVYTLGRLKRVRVSAVGRYWQEKMDSLSRALGIRQAVILLESSIAQVPLVIGYLKPVVLVPIGLINSIEPTQVEAILLHELVHIRRSDYLVNMLQIVLEAFFFFNPAVLWLSRLIRTERENCCDDMVIARTRNQLGYMEALVHFEEYRMAAPRKAIALTGVPGSMLTRFERISAGKNRSLGRRESIVLAILLIFCAVFMVVTPRSAVRSTLNVAAPSITDKNSKDFKAKKKAEAIAIEQTRHKKISPYLE